MLQLLEDDGVPGSKLNPVLLHQYVSIQLERWLECRGLPKAGKKAEKIKRIQNHIANGQSHILDPKVDQGVWLEAKRDGTLATITHQDQQVNRLVTSKKCILPVTGWRQFPGYNIPANFNEGHVYHYLVESVPEIWVNGRIMSFEEDDGSDNEDFEAAAPGSEKLFRKAKRSIDSGFVQEVQDCLLKGKYFVRCHVRASMMAHRYKVDLAVSGTSGAVLYAECHKCPASAMDRCCHISAVLLYMVKHVSEHGHSAVPSTSRPKQWGKGSVDKDPGPCVRSEYYSKWDVKRRKVFDVRPTALQKNELTDQDIYNFVRSIQQGHTTIPTAWELMLPIHYPDGPFPFSDPSLKYLVIDLCEKFYFEMEESISGDPYLIPGTERQAESKVWLQIRPYLFTASEAKKICGLSEPSAKRKFLREHLWGIKRFKGNAATRYGTKMEPLARASYTRIIKRKDPNLTVEETGLWVKKDLPYLGCSPDGLVKKNGITTKILEIKCPHILRNVHPKNFYKELTPKQLQNFPLKRTEEGDIVLKKTHTYYYQVQMQMDVMQVNLCDFFIWSKKGFLCVEVECKPSFWREKIKILDRKHRSLLMPEYFLMRTPRKLDPWDLNDQSEEDLDVLEYLGL